MPDQMDPLSSQLFPVAKNPGQAVKGGCTIPLTCLLSAHPACAVPETAVSPQPRNPPALDGPQSLHQPHRYPSVIREQGEAQGLVFSIFEKMQYGPWCIGPENPKDEREANAACRDIKVVCHSHLLGAGPRLFPHQDNITNFISASG